MKLTTIASAIAAFAAVGNCNHFNINNFYYKHHPNSNTTLAYFDVAYEETANPSRCYAQAVGRDDFHLRRFENQKCELDYYSWSIDRSGPNGAFKFRIYYADSGGSYIFPAKDVTTYQANKLLSNEKESYQQLTPANGMFLVSDVNSPDK